MAADSLATFEPRKMPSQARSAVTVGSISEATIQVLLSSGLDRLTTTRVAQRAGVSVGTLYQYYPNKQSLLFAVLENHFANVLSHVEIACKDGRHKPLAVMVRQLVEAFVDVKMQRADISAALYKISGDIGGPELVKKFSRQARKEVEALLRTASDIESPPERFCVEMMMAAMSGAMRALLENGAQQPATIRKAREQLVLLCQSYLSAVTTSRP